MVERFAAKPSPSREKLRGGYYTPLSIAKFVAEWVGQSGSEFLEPSCGDGEILRFLPPQARVTGIELIPTEAKKARNRSNAGVIEDDFFSWFREDKYGFYDGVAGNPPYIRFGSWDEVYRSRAFKLMESQGLSPSRLTNAWLPFVVGSLLAVKDGGRVGLVLPAELLQVGYASELRAYLVDNCKTITIVAFQELVFPGVLQEVVLLLAQKGIGPASISTVEVKNGDELRNAVLGDVSFRAPLHATEKWTKYFLDKSQIVALRKLLSDNRFSPLKNYARVNVGVVTGRNSFFCLTDKGAMDLGLKKHTISLMSRSAQFTGVDFTSSDLKLQSTAGAVTRLLSLSPDYPVASDAQLQTYIKLGEADKVHEGYKCRIRESWWSVPSISTPSGFMLRQVSSYLRMINNDAKATSTDTVHRVFCEKGVDMRKLSVAALNSATIAMSEVLGRSYGGGLLEIEPREAVSLPIPDPELVDDDLIQRVDNALRLGKVAEAIEIVDDILLMRKLGFSKIELSKIRGAGERLRNRRLGRGKGRTVS